MDGKINEEIEIVQENNPYVGNIIVSKETVYNRREEIQKKKSDFNKEFEYKKKIIEKKIK